MNRIIFQSRSIRFYFSESHNGNYIRVITLSKPSLELLKEEKEKRKSKSSETINFIKPGGTRAGGFAEWIRRGCSSRSFSSLQRRWQSRDLLPKEKKNQDLVS